MLRVDGSSCLLYLRDCSCCSCFWHCWWFVVAGSLVVLVGGWLSLSSYLVLVFWLLFLLSSRVQASMRFPNLTSSSVFGRRRPLGLQKVVQLQWVHYLDDLRFFSSAKKDGTVGMWVALNRCSGRCLWWLSLWLVLVCLCSIWFDLRYCSTFSPSLNLALGYWWAEFG